MDLTAAQLKEAHEKGIVNSDQVQKIAKVVKEGKRLMEKLGGK